jgi:hypothetical protein
MKIGGDERKFEAINQQTFAKKKLLNLDFIQQDSKSEYIFPNLIDLFKKIDSDLFYNAYEKINITHVNTFEQFFEYELVHNFLVDNLYLDHDIKAGNQISLNISNRDIEYLSRNTNKSYLSNKFIHYLSIKSSVNEIQEFLEK